MVRLEMVHFQVLVHFCVFISL